MTQISVKTIYAIAKKYKSYVEKNKKNPKTVKINNKEYSYQSCAYLFTKFIVAPNKEVKLISLKPAAKPGGDAISENVLKSDYTDMAKRLSTYVEKNKQLPNYVTTKKSKKRVGPGTYIYAFSKIVVFYANKKQMPNYVTINSGALGSTSSSTSSSSSSLNPYFTNSGCSGMGQCTGYYCACNSLQQAFYRLTGAKVSEYTIAGWAGTTSAGTGHAGIETAVAKFNKEYNKNIKITWKNFSDLGSSDSARWSALQSYINKGAVFCHLNYRDQWGHYEVPKSVGSDNLAIINSLGDSCGGESYCGYIETRSKSTQLRYINGISQKSIAILTKG